MAARDADPSEAAGFKLTLPKNAMAYLIGALISGGVVSGSGAYFGAKGADPQVIAETEANKARKDCEAKLETVMNRLDGRLASIEGNVSDIKLRLSFVEQSYRLYSRGTLGAPTISNQTPNP